MSQPFETSVVNKIRIRKEMKAAFIDWQAKLNVVIAAFPGFVSLEMLLSPADGPLTWLIVERFNTTEDLLAWRSSSNRLQLFKEVKSLIDDGANALYEVKSASLVGHGGITEVFITQVNPKKEIAFQQWIAKIHQVEAKFPGFRGVYVQSPAQAHGKNWITLLQFDTQENLDRWVASPERAEVVHEGNELIASIETHRLISPYAGWFAAFANSVEPPAVWKQTMLVLLVLFPIVMLELTFLSPLLTDLPFPISTFIGNAISVSLVSWPTMPLAIYFLGWWLAPNPVRKRKETIKGALVVLACYIIEIAFLWNLKS